MKVLTDNNLVVLWNKIKDLYKKISVSANQTTISTEDGGTNIMTFTFGDGTSTTLSVKNGSKGSNGTKGDKGDQGIQGIQGPKGDKGDKGIQGPVGPKGDKGDQGDQGIQGPKGDAFTYNDFTKYQLALFKGDRGPIGETGPQGNSGIADASSKALINDVVTGGETSYLSAEVGKLGIFTYDCSKGGTVNHESLQDAINAVPTTFKKAGISIIYKSGDSIYHYTLKSNTWSSNSANWFSVEDKLWDLQLYSQNISLDVFGFDELTKFNGAIEYTGWEINAGQHVQILIRKGDVVKVNGTANGCYLAVLNEYGQPTTSNISYAKNEERRVCPAWGEVSFTIFSDDAKCLAVELNRGDTSTKPAGISINGKNLYTYLSASVDRKSMVGQICPPFNEGSYINITQANVFIPENTRINCAGKYFSLNETTLKREIGEQCEVVYFDIESETLKIIAIPSYVQSTSNYVLFVVSYDKNKICSLPVTFYTYNGKTFEDRLMDKVNTDTSMFVSSKLVNQCYYNKEKSLSLLWLSDIYGDSNALKCAVRFRNEFNDFLDDCIHTGDSVSGTISDATPFENVLGANSFLNVIGNHEAWLSASDDDYYATEKQTYDKIFKNNIDNWFVTQPSNAAENGKCYYYKDYPDKGYRLIVLDSVHWKVHNDNVTSNALQKEWLEQTLTDAISNSLAVIIATHYPPVTGITFSKGAKGFNSLKYSEQESAIISDGWFSAEEMFSCVDKFIDDGGKFISWIIGHVHSDYIGVVTSHTRQTVVVMEGSGIYSPSDSNIHLANSNSQIAFNVITFDEENNLLKITRVGNNTDIWLQPKNSICYNYNTHKVIYCE